MAETVVRHRPFWSISILKTEKWLGGMSSSGFHLCSLNFKGTFRFKVGKPQKCKYCFVYTKFEGPQINVKSNKQGCRDWEKVAQHDKWGIYKNTKGKQQSPMPNRQGLYLHNNSRLCLYAILSSVVLLVALATVFELFVYLGHQSISNDDYFRRAVAIVGVFALLLLGNFVLFLTMTLANNRILEEPGDAVTSENAYWQFLRHKTFEVWLEKLLIKDGDIRKKFRPFWFISPRRLENWLSRMESRGLNIYKVHKSGTLFYFIKGAPRSIKYCMINCEGGNISQYIENGWQVVYLSAGRFGLFGGIAVFSQVFESEIELPFKSEKDYVSNAARIMLKFVIFYFILLLVLMGVLFPLVYFKAAGAIILIVGAVAAACTLLIVRMLLYLANSVLIASRGILKNK